MRPASVLMVCVSALLGIGVVMVHSAGMRIDDAKLGDPLAVFRGANAVYAGLALLAFVVVSRVNATSVLESRGPIPMLSPAMVLLLIAVLLTVLAQIPGIGRPVNGAWRWIRIGSFQFQPSELVKYAAVIALAWWATRGTDMSRFRSGLLPALGMLTVCCGVVVREDLGTAVLIGCVGLLVVLAAGARWWQVGLVVPPALAAAAVLVATSDYRRQRIIAFLDPWQDAAGSGYHAIQSLLAFAGGGITGRGLGGGIQKFGYVPEDTTDFIFAIVAEELGLAGCGVVMALYLVLLWAGLQVVRSTPNRFAALLALGITLTIVLQATLNIAVVTVTVPTKGIALPLISRGGTGWLAAAAALGLVASMDRRQALIAAKAMVPNQAARHEDPSDEDEAWEEESDDEFEEDLDADEDAFLDDVSDEIGDEEEWEEEEDDEHEYEEDEYENDDVDDESQELLSEVDDVDLEDDEDLESAASEDEDTDEYEYEDDSEYEDDEIELEIDAEEIELDDAEMTSEDDSEPRAGLFEVA